MPILDILTLVPIVGPIYQSQRLVRGEEKNLYHIRVFHQRLLERLKSKHRNELIQLEQQYRRAIVLWEAEIQQKLDAIDSSDDDLQLLTQALETCLTNNNLISLKHLHKLKNKEIISIFLTLCPLSLAVLANAVEAADIIVKLWGHRIQLTETSPFLDLTLGKCLMFWPIISRAELKKNLNWQKARYKFRAVAAQELKDWITQRIDYYQVWNRNPIRGPILPWPWENVLFDDTLSRTQQLYQLIALLIANPQQRNRENYDLDVITALIYVTGECLEGIGQEILVSKFQNLLYRHALHPEVLMALVFNGYSDRTHLETLKLEHAKRYAHSSLQVPLNSDSVVEILEYAEYIESHHFLQNGHSPKPLLDELFPIQSTVQ